MNLERSRLTWFVSCSSVAGRTMERRGRAFGEGLCKGGGECLSAITDRSVKNADVP